jgi:hypothetical protein
MPKQLALPPTLPPRLIRRDAAAAYCNLSPNMFDLAIEQGILPHARRILNRCRGWDVRELDLALDALPHIGDGTDGGAGEHAEPETVSADEGWG